MKVKGGLAANCARGAYGTGQRLERPSGRTTIFGSQTLGWPASQKTVSGARS